MQTPISIIKFDDELTIKKHADKLLDRVLKLSVLSKNYNQSYKDKYYQNFKKIDSYELKYYKDRIIFKHNDYHYEFSISNQFEVTQSLEHKKHGKIECLPKVSSKEVFGFDILDIYFNKEIYPDLFMDISVNYASLHTYLTKHHSFKMKHLSKIVNIYRRKLILANADKISPDFGFIIKSLNINDIAIIKALAFNDSTKKTRSQYFFEFIKKYKLCVFYNTLNIKDYKNIKHKQKMFDYIESSIHQNKSEYEIMNNILCLNEKKYDKWQIKLFSSLGSRMVNYHNNEKIINLIKKMLETTGDIGFDKGVVFEKGLGLIKSDIKTLSKIDFEIALFIFEMNSAKHFTLPQINIPYTKESKKAIIKFIKQTNGIKRPNNSDIMKLITNVNDYYSFLLKYGDSSIKINSLLKLLKMSEKYHNSLMLIDNITEEELDKEYGKNQLKLNWYKPIESFKYNIRRRSTSDTDKYYQIDFIDNEKDLIEEGKVNSHCVGNYLDYCLTGKSFIFSIKCLFNGGSGLVPKIIERCTMEITYSTDKKKFNVRQISGYRNETVNIPQKIIDEILTKLNQLNYKDLMSNYISMEQVNREITEEIKERIKYRLKENFIFSV